MVCPFWLRFACKIELAEAAFAFSIDYCLNTLAIMDAGKISQMSIRFEFPPEILVQNARVAVAVENACLFLSLKGTYYIIEVQ